MLIKDEVLVFVALDRLKGVSKEGKEYDFTKVKLMDDNFEVLSLTAGTELFSFDNTILPLLSDSKKGAELVCEIEITSDRRGYGLTGVLRGVEEKS